MEPCYQVKYKSGNCDCLKIRTKLQVNFILIIIFKLLFLNALVTVINKEVEINLKYKINSKKVNSVI